MEHDQSEEKINSGERDYHIRDVRDNCCSVFYFMIFRRLMETAADVWQLGVETLDQLTTGIPK